MAIIHRTKKPCAFQASVERALHAILYANASVYRSPARGYSRCGVALAVAGLSAVVMLPRATFAQRTADEALPTVRSLPLRTFQDSMGINTHVEYTDGKYADAQKVLSDLEYLGIHSVRDGIPNPIGWQPPGQGLAAEQLLAAHGVRFDFITDGNAGLPMQMTQLDNLVRKYPSVALSVEGPNEINNFPVKSATQPNEQAAEAFQRSLYKAVHTDPLLRGVPVYYMTGAEPVDLSTSPGLADVANTHPYPHNGEQPYTWLNRDFPTYFKTGDASAKLEKAITETGYYTQPSSTNPGGVDEQTQAELVLTAYFDGALQGNSHTYLYQLLDAYPDLKNNNSDDHYGFYQLDGSPKPIADALHVLSQVLPLDQPSAQQAVRARLPDLPGTAHALALTASNGAVILFIWNEVPVWDEQAKKAISVAPIPIHVVLPGEWSAHFFAPIAAASHEVERDAAGAYNTLLYPYPTALVFRRK